MPLIFAPHTVTIKPATESVDGTTKAVSVPAYGTGSNIPCYVYPTSASATFEKYGVDLSRPYELMCNLAYRSNFTVGTHILWGTRTFTVKAPGMVHEGGGIVSPVDHLSVLMEELQYG